MKLFRNELIKKSLICLITFTLLICMIPFQKFTGIVKAASPVQIENAKIQRYDSEHPNDFNADKLVVFWTQNSEFTNYHIKIGLKPGGAEIVNTVVSNTSQFKYYKSVPTLLTYYLSISGINKQGESTEIATDSAFARKVYSASLVSSNIPELMEIDRHQNMSITVKNDGLESWTKEKGYCLASSETDYFTGNDEFQLDTDDLIKTNESKTFDLPFYSGKTKTTKTTKWHMVRNSDQISINAEKAVTIKDSMLSDNQVNTTTQNSNGSVSTMSFDIQPPTGDFTINNGSSFTNSQDLNIYTTASDNVDTTLYRSLSSDGSYYTPYEMIYNPLTWRTTPGEGEKRIYMKIKDSSGNVRDLGSKFVILDQTMPKAELKPISLNTDTSSELQISGTANDNYIDHYQLQYAKDGNVDNTVEISTSTNGVDDGVLADWQTYNVESGLYTIYLAVTDAAGNTSYDSSRVIIGADWFKQAYYQGIEDYYKYDTQKIGNGSLSINLQEENGVVQIPDIKMSTQGSISYQLVRTLNSSKLGPNSWAQLGEGWTFTGSERIETDWYKRSISYYDQNGALHQFYAGDGYNFTDLSGSKLKFSNIYNDGQTVHFQITDSSGIKKNFKGSYNDSTYNIDSYEDLNHNKIQFEYDSSRLVKIYEKDPSGTEVGTPILFSYNQNQNVSRVNYGNITINYTYLNGLLTKVTYQYQRSSGQSLSYSTDYTYDANGSIKNFTDPNGHTTQFTFGDGNIQVTDADGKVTTYNYSDDTTTVTSGNKTDTYYLNTSDYRRPVDTIVSSDGSITSYQYNDDLNCTSETTTTKDNDGITTGQTILTRVFESPYYLSEEQAKTITYENGVPNQPEIEYTKDYSYGLNDGIDPLGFFSLGDYSSSVTNIADRSSVVTRQDTSFDNKGNITTEKSTTTENGTTTDSENTTYTYDSMGRVTSVINPDLSKETNQYNGLVLVQKKYANQNDTTPISETSTTSDMYGNLADVTDGNGHKTLYEYNPLNDTLLKITDAKNKTTSYEYDNNGNLTSTKDALDRMKNYTYDVNNQPLSVNLPIIGILQYAYNSDRNLTKLTKFSGITQNFTYDDYKNPTSIVTSNGSGKTLTQSNSFDSNNQVVGTTLKDQSDNVLSSKTFAYNSNNNLTANTQGDNFSLGYQYNDSNNTNSATNKSIVYKNSSGTENWSLAQALSYTSEGKLSTLSTTGLSQLMSYAYSDDKANKKTILRVNPMSNGELFSKTSTLNTANELTSINYAGAVNQSISYVYDNAGNITSETTSNGTSSYQYDANNQLTNETLPDGTTNGYSYDAIGNRTSDTRNGVTDTFTYNGANQILTKNGVSFSYDSDGNLTQDENYKYEYNVLGQQTRITTLQGVEVARYEYDENNLRTKKIIGNETHEYYYESNNLSLEIIRDENGIKQYRYYQWDSTRTPLGMVIREKDGSGNWQEKVYHFLTNHRGDVVSILDNSGEIVGSYTYDSYGNLLSETGDIAQENSIRYAGYYYDSETKNYYLQARFYNPENGSFLALDPHPGYTDDLISQNGYTYANNNPAMYVDPDGYFSKTYKFLKGSWVSIYAYASSKLVWKWGVPTGYNISLRLSVTLYIAAIDAGAVQTVIATLTGLLAGAIVSSTGLGGIVAPVAYGFGGYMAGWLMVYIPQRKDGSIQGSKSFSKSFYVGL